MWGPRDTHPDRCSHTCRGDSPAGPLVHRPPRQKAGGGGVANYVGRQVAREVWPSLQQSWPVPTPAPHDSHLHMLPVPAWKGPGQSHPFEKSTQNLPRESSPGGVPARPSLADSFVQQALTVHCVCRGWARWQRSQFPRGVICWGGQIVIKETNKFKKKKKDEFMVQSSMKERTQGL